MSGVLKTRFLHQGTLLSVERRCEVGGNSGASKGSQHGDKVDESERIRGWSHGSQAE